MDKRILAMRQQVDASGDHDGSIEALVLEFCEDHMARNDLVAALLGDGQEALPRLLALAGKYNPGTSLEGLRDASEIDALHGRMTLAAMLAPRTKRSDPAHTLSTWLRNVALETLRTLTVQPGSELAKQRPRLFLDLHTAGTVKDAVKAFISSMLAIGVDPADTDSMLVDATTHAIAATARQGFARLRNTEEITATFAEIPQIFDMLRRENTDLSDPSPDDSEDTDEANAETNAQAQPVDA